MAFQFPASPAVNQTFTPVAGTTYRWSGTAWHLLAGPGAFITTADADTRYVNVDEVSNTTNRIINGKMAIDQRNAGAAHAVVSNVDKYTLDRWRAFPYGDGGTLGVQRTVDSFYTGEYRLTTQVGVANPILPAGAFFAFQYAVEGYNVADCHFGSAAASPITIAFEIESSLAGTFCLTVGNGTRSYVVPFTVAASVRETKVITIPGDTTGTWDKTNGKGMDVNFTFGIGTNFQTATTNTWLAGNFVGVTGQTNFMATAGNTFHLRNVRLYKGSVDFGPDRRLYAEELALCQRYYCKSYSIDVAPGTASATEGMFSVVPHSTNVGFTQVGITFPVTMRTGPTITLYSQAGVINTWSNGAPNISAGTVSSGPKNMTVHNLAVATLGQSFNGHFTASAEL